MKINKLFISSSLLAMLLSSCDDQIMEWGRPDGQQTVTESEIPLAVKEVLANYEPIKTYAQQYMPNTVIGLGMSAAMYNESASTGSAYKTLADENFQMFTTGNAMKMDAVVGNSGNMTWTAVDNMLDNMPADMRLYGHNFIWYQQQSQTYLKSLIAPTMVIKTDGDIASILKNGSFDSDVSSWSSWGNSSTREWLDKKDNQNGVVHLHNPSDGADYYVAQFVQDVDPALTVGTEYTLRFKAKASSSTGSLQFAAQMNKSPYSGEGYHAIQLSTDWQTYEYKFTPTKEGMNRLCLNFGKVAGDYWLDDIQFGVKKEDPMKNILTGDNSNFDGGTKGKWSSWGGSSSSDVEEGAGRNGSHALVLKNPDDKNFWDAQCAYTFDNYLDSSKVYMIQFWVRSSSAAGQVQFQYQNGTTYGSQGAYSTFSPGTEWYLCEKKFKPAYDNVNRIIINFGKVSGNYYIDDVKFGIAKDQTLDASAKQFRFVKRYAGRPRRATTITYVVKSPEEKRTVLLGAMDSWIKGCADHLKEKNVVPYGYDVINEPITDGTNKVRGVDAGAFGGSSTDDNGNVTYDTAPEESAADGLTLNWGDNRFYWGYYVKDYAVQAFRKARKYLPAETKLFVNDYNLEVSPGKLQALIKFVNDIDKANGSPIVDGIGSQVHFNLKSATDNVTENDSLIARLRKQVDEMFTTMAATGKLIRITELDVALGTSSPSAAQYKCQSDCYKMIFESYKKNVPEAQQSGITIWTLSDNEKEHEYWLKGDVPNLFDADYLRKWSYKGACDGIAGEDLGLKYGGDAYKAYYEKQNVSSTVAE